MKRSVVLISFLCLTSFAGRMAAQVSRASIHEPKSPHHSAELIDQPKELIPPSHAKHQEPMMEPPHGLLETPAMPTPEDNHPLRHQLGQPSPSHTPNALHAAPQSRRQAPADRSEMTRPASAAAHRAPTATATGQSGTVGENIQWKLENGTLTFSGEGEVQEIVDWTEVAPQVTDVVFEEGITGICASFFNGNGNFEQVVSLSLPASVTHIDAYAFWDFYNLQTVTIASITAPQLDPNAFYNWHTLVVPDGYSQAYNNVEPWYWFNIIDPGTFACGDGLTCSYNALDHYLQVYGEGPMWADVDLVRGHEADIQWIYIAEGVTSLADGAFQGLSLIKYIDNVPLSLEQIGSYAFAGDAQLREINLPRRVESIGQGAFQGCTSLEYISCQSAVAPLLGEDALTSVAETGTLAVPEGSDYSSWMSQLPEGWTVQYTNSIVEGQCSEQVFWSFDNTTGELAITGEGPMESAPWGGYWNMIESVEIDNGITSLAPRAFQSCIYLKTITIPKSVITFGEDVDGQGSQFDGCSSLTSVIFEEGCQLTNIPPYAFSWCNNLQSITIPKSVTTFGENYNGNGRQFHNCSSLTSVIFEEGSQLTNIPSYAFYNCYNLQSITIPKSVTSFGEDYNGYGRQFYNCSSLTSVIFEDGSQLTNIPSYAFYYCNNLQSITIPKSVTTFGEDNNNQGAQFYGCSSLTSVKFEDNSQLEELPNWTFGWCTALKSITIPKSITSFGQDNINGWGCQFCSCDSLQTVIFEEGSKLTEIASHAFEGCVSLHSIKIPNSVTTFTTDINNVGSQFNWCESLTSVEFEKGSQLTELPSYAFNECYLLESITIPKSVVAFGTTTDGYEWGGQFSDCQSLRDVTFEQGSLLANISAYAFNNCYSLQSITALTNEVPSLSTDVFAGLPETGILTTHAGKDFSSWMEQLPEGWTLIQKNMTGDLDGDGEVSISDAVGIINFIIHSATEGLDEQAADMNGDGVISIADAVMAVNTVLHVNGAAANGRRLPMTDVDATLTMSPMTVAKNTTFDLPVILNGAANAYTALQSTLHLPQGVTLTAVTSADGHAVRYAEQEDGSICMVSLSLSNATFAGNGDAIFILHLQTDDTFEGGLVMLDEMEIVIPSLHASHPSAVGALLTEGATTINDIPMMDGEHTEYDLSGRVGQGTQGVYIEKGKKYYRK